MASKLDDVLVTPEELERFRTAFHDARFRELFAQYAAEISNPENRLRYEQEICEMERQRGMDVQFIHPTPDHVLQTTVNGQQTCYLNICSNPVVSKPSCVPGTDQTGRQGMHWSLPCTFTPPREELSSDGNKELIYDVVFHPDTLNLASKNERFFSMVDLTALDTVSQHFKVVLDTRNLKTLNEKYKGVPHAAVIRTPRPGATPNPQDPNLPLRFPYPYGEPGRMSRNMDQQRPYNASGECGSQSQEPTIPHYTIKHRSYVDIQDFRNTRDSAPSPVPKELVIIVDLPLLSCASQFIFSIKGKEFSLESHKPAYRLQINLPYPVDGEQGNARFDTTKRQLEVVVPVVRQDSSKLIQDHTLEDTSEEEEISPIESPTTEEATTDDESPDSSLDPAECPIFTCSQDATTVTLIIHVKDVDKHSVRYEVRNYQCEIHFCVKMTNNPYILFVEFLPQYNLNVRYIVVKISEDNLVIELTKASGCFGPWKNLFFGVNSNSLRERRFINEENVAEFLENGLPPVPWSTLEDQPQINLIHMNDERTLIHLNKPELEGKYYLHGREVSDENEVSEQSNCHSDLSDTSETEDMVAPCCTSFTAQTSAQLLGTDASTEEDEGLFFKEITPARELDEDDLLDAAECTHSSPPSSSSTKPVLKEVNSSDGSVHVISEHRTQCAIKFENPVLFDLD
ncbi:protein kintoun [Leptodactylus fuscus]|uniref:protein kintoun n=1 Tax=Leptodactylus fuscus TaxID=238119 RepID=UPI003F4E7F6C